MKKRNKILAMLLSIFIITLTHPMNIFASESNKEEYNTMLIKTDAATGEKTLISLDDIPSDLYQDQDNPNRETLSNIQTPDISIQPTMIWGTDNRTKVSNISSNPYKMVVLIETEYTDGSIVYATGFMVSSKTMLTAAHAINFKGRDAKRITIFVGLNGVDTLSSCTTYNASSWYVCASYDPYAATDHNDDYAIVRFSSNATSSWFGLRVPSNDNDLQGYAISTSGYPGELGGLTQYYCSGKIDAVRTYYVTHTTDTTDGQSGSPLYSYISGKGYVADAIVTGTSSSEGMNVARRMTSELFDWLLANSFITN